jgi:hypothetical protein
MNEAFCQISEEFQYIIITSYECETWSLTLREEHRLKALQTKEMRRIFGPRREEVKVVCKKIGSPIIYTLHRLLLGISNEEG